MKKRFLTMVALLLSLIMALGMVSFSALAEEPVEIRIMGYNTPDSRATWLAYIQEQLPEYKITYEFVENADFNQILTAQLVNGAGPDIIEGGGNTKLMANAGYLLDLTDQPFVAKYAQAGLAAYILDGKVWGTPMQSWFEGIFYNKAIFAEHGISVPKSLDEFIQVHKDLTAAGVKPQTMGASSWEPMMKQSIGVVNNMFYSDPANNDFDAGFNTGESKLAEGWLEGVTAWARVIEEGCLTTDMLGMDYNQAQAEFAAGGAAMWESGPWAEQPLLAANPDLDYGMFPIPGAEEGPGWLVGGPGSSLTINANTKNLEGALKVLEVTATPEAQAALIADNPGSSFLLGYSSELGERYADCMDAFAAGNVYAPWVAVWAFGDGVVEPYGKSLQELLAGTKTVAEALADADRACADLIDELK